MKLLLSYLPSQENCVPWLAFSKPSVSHRALRLTPLVFSP